MKICFHEQTIWAVKKSDKCLWLLARGQRTCRHALLPLCWYVSGFCKSATLEEIRQHGYVLTPGRYVGAPEQEEDDEPFEAKMARLVAQLAQQQAKARRLDEATWKNLKELGYGG